MQKKSHDKRPVTDHSVQNNKGASKPVPPLPTVGHPLDGSQYQNIVEEQRYSEQRPSREEQQPRRANEDKTR